MSTNYPSNSLVGFFRIRTFVLSTPRPGKAKDPEKYQIIIIMTMEEHPCVQITKHDHSGQRATAIGLAAGLGGGALLLAIAGIWGVNQASKSRVAGAYAGIAANTAALGSLNNNVNANRSAIENSLATERMSRENWQSRNQPSIQSYIDVQATPSAQSNATAVADAYALAAAINNNGLNSAIGHEAFVKVQRYSAPQPCGCDACNTCCG